MMHNNGRGCGNTRRWWRRGHQTNHHRRASKDLLNLSVSKEEAGKTINAGMERAEVGTTTPLRGWWVVKN
jgi:hypothetical protein